MNPLRATLLAASRSARLRRWIEHTPAGRALVERFVAGVLPRDAARAAAAILPDGRRVTVHYLGEDITDAAGARDVVSTYRALLAMLHELGRTPGVEVSVKLSAIGQALPRDGAQFALDGARQICAAAAAANTTVTIDMEGYSTVDSTLGTVRELHADFPWVGVVLQSYLARTEADCRDFAHARVRLCKGAYTAPRAVAYQHRPEVDRSYVRCLRRLMAGSGYPMVATHDSRLIRIATELAAAHRRGPDAFEIQMLYGVREAEQRRLAGRGQQLRVYVPYGDAWYGYFLRRLAERPANLAFFLRALVRRDR